MQALKCKDVNGPDNAARLWNEVISLAKDIWQERLRDSDPKWGLFVRGCGQLVDKDPRVRTVEHPAFLLLVHSGANAIPWILRQYNNLDGDGWWCPLALGRITGVRPIKQEHAGRYEAIRQDWLEWGRRKYLLGEERFYPPAGAKVDFEVKSSEP